MSFTHFIFTPMLLYMSTWRWGVRGWHPSTRETFFWLLKFHTCNKGLCYCLQSGVRFFLIDFRITWNWCASHKEQQVMLKCWNTVHDAIKDNISPVWQQSQKQTVVVIQMSFKATSEFKFTNRTRSVLIGFMLLRPVCVCDTNNNFCLMPCCVLWCSVVNCF